MELVPAPTRMQSYDDKGESVVVGGGCATAPAPPPRGSCVVLLVMMDDGRQPGLIVSLPSLFIWKEGRCRCRHMNQIQASQATILY